MSSGGSGRPGGGGGGGVEEQAVKNLDTTEQIELKDGVRVTKIEKNAYLIDGNVKEPVLVNRQEAKDFLKVYKDELKNSGLITPIEKKIKETKNKISYIDNILKNKTKDIDNNMLGGIKQKTFTPRTKTDIAMTKVINTIDKTGKLESNDTKIFKIDSKTYMINHPDFSTPEFFNKSELRRFIRQNENEFDGFRKSA